MKDYRQFLASDSFVILLLHGVIRNARHPVRNYTAKHITLDRFVTVLRDLIGAGGVPISLDEVVSATHTKASLPKHAFAVTFDDGFANNHSIAAPALADLNVPAVFYVTTGFVESNSSSWTDLIEYAIEVIPVVHMSIGLPGIDGRHASAEEKIRLLEAIRTHVKGSPAIDPYTFARDIWSALGVTEMQHDVELDQKLSWAQVRSLADDPRFIVGGHSHTHRILEFLPQSDLEQEIDLNLSLLRQHLGRPVKHYSYPEGLRHCYSPRVVQALSLRGIVCSPSAQEGVNKVGDSLFDLRRVTVT